VTVTAPKCKLCGVAHWSTQPHAWEKGPKAEDAPGVARAVLAQAEARVGVERVKDVTKPPGDVTKPPASQKPKGGRPRKGEVAVPTAERVAAHRARKKGDDK
jgi:hypothetical protein